MVNQFQISLIKFQLAPLHHGVVAAAAEGPRDDPRAPGEAVQLAPIKPTLKPPGTERLKPKCDDPLSNFAFSFNLRCYSLDALDELLAAG